MAPPALASLHLHPVKSLAALTVDEAEVEPWGLAGDRRWMLVDRTGTAVTQRQEPRLTGISAMPLPGGGVELSAPGRVRLAVAVPERAETVVVELFGKKLEVVEAAPAAHAWLSGFLGAEVRLVHQDAPSYRRPVDPAYARPGETVSLADGYPLLVTTASSLDALNALIASGDHPSEGPLPMNRFRPNAVIDGTVPWEEDGWRRIAIGAVAFRVVKPCARCVITTTDQSTAVRGKEPLRTLAVHRRSGTKLVFGQNLVPEGTGTVRVGDPFRVLG
ncbi:MOSC domain-containing protein [Streptomyces sp. NBC_00102]|uniref:MOSC domain-containing protein n=1 Tax=Streptomyces sp. NBC_00102 TaxID=2975652 RepID=UPI002258A49D|nr:MOSC N-terminal beta barrel domain-containing protein [Streptomyces sp. NBC_00102]MCX5401537.1 MOSC domain-containing protein [Streptomyces sp. NBC_00102]